MVLVRKVGEPSTVDVAPLPPRGQDLLRQAHAELKLQQGQNQVLQSEIDRLKSQPPQTIEVEKKVEVEVQVDNPVHLQLIADLELENQSLQRSLTAYGNKTTAALTTSADLRLAAERKLEQAESKLKQVEQATFGRWPLLFKKTIRNLLKEN